MAAKPYRIFLALVILIAAGIATILFVGSRFSHTSRTEEAQFISTYADLSIARERHALGPTDLPSEYDRIYAAHGVDSAWIHDYADEISKDLTKAERIWEEIVDRIDSLQGRADSSAPRSAR